MIDITNTPINIRPLVARELSRIGRQIILLTRKSIHKEDEHLYTVIAREYKTDDSAEPYSVHLFNSSLGSLNCGVYGLKFSEALEKASKGIVD